MRQLGPLLSWIMDISLSPAKITDGRLISISLERAFSYITPVTKTTKLSILVPNGHITQHDASAPQDIGKVSTNATTPAPLIIAVVVVVVVVGAVVAVAVVILAGVVVAVTVAVVAVVAVVVVVVVAVVVVHVAVLLVVVEKATRQYYSLSRRTFAAGAEKLQTGKFPWSPAW